MKARPLLIKPGSPTAYPFNIAYRLGRTSKYFVGGSWLDFGCADGGYTAALLRAGADRVCGVDTAIDRIQAARESHPDIAFYASRDGTVPFAACSFDGVFMNEVLEHVADEALALREAYRVLRPGGHLILMSPNRCFPFEGHEVRIRNRVLRWAPLLPWLPKRLTNRWVSARNYWPSELRRRIRSSGLQIVETGYIPPVLEAYRCLPEVIIQRYRRNAAFLETLPIVARFCSVSTLVVAQRPR